MSAQFPAYSPVENRGRSKSYQPLPPRFYAPPTVRRFSKLSTADVLSGICANMYGTCRPLLPRNLIISSPLPPHRIVIRTLSALHMPAVPDSLR